ncbi:DUF370 domain-containing protein [Finegoldia magna]|uniref:DUF370 domain-containing protein n=1 Tax=Finegoldia TaxID=150022 RepID=UPI0025D4D06F|nr:DUF370 domain-containing protein [Finegoldia magna]MDU1831543.1 DUF370 domain-containing protein [Finegoldia magna]MDU1878550.1 DUF370 domain-containing protein [Finegoldia magna]MDU5070252.1 DUF370 domain-containing protein [Finegoldia magna]MDU5978023.1 DUF370 domain-containing protein [Finegoldia magna]MDU5998203.1 DUF370 domain-containing protein [Finegoldia magna]
MYLDIGNNRLIDENEIIVIVNVSDKFFDDFSKNDLEYTKNVEFINEDDNIAIRSIVITNRGVYKSNISGTYLMNNFMKGI